MTSLQVFLIADKVQTSPLVQVMMPGEKKVFQTSIRARRQIGAPISIHTETGAYRMEQIEMLQAGGVPTDKFIIGHLDRKLN